MDETTLKMTMGGFFHDIGKLADREVLPVTQTYFDDHAGLYLPFRQNRYTHQHAVYTAAFIEQMADLLPPCLNRGDWGDGDAFINLAAGHHKPETAMQRIIAISDRLTSGMDRDEFEEADQDGVPIRDYRKTRLIPLLEQLKNPNADKRDQFAYTYPLKRLSSSSIFPELLKKSTHTEAKTDYRSLYEGFIEHLARLRHKQDNIGLWFEHFENLMMDYTSCVPAARVGHVVPDVSLYEHSRLTAAFSAALYRFHGDTGSLKVQDVEDRTRQKLLLISGNFFGIQDFIFNGYGDSRKYRSKLLRGRSFYVSLLTEMAADLLCEALGLPSICVILNAAGRFTLLAPHTENALQSVENVKQEINNWLVKVSFGELNMGFCHVPACLNDFTEGRFITLWEQLGTAGEIPKFQKLDLEQHGGVVSGYLDRFDNRLPHPLCPLCGKRPAVKETRKDFPDSDAEPVCTLCRDHVMLGNHLVKHNQIIVLKAHENRDPKMHTLWEPLFGSRQILFSSSEEPLKLAQGEHILKEWHIYTEDSAFRGVRKYVNGYVPVYDEQDESLTLFLETEKSESKKLEMMEEIEPGAIKSFHHMAAAALWRDADDRKRGVEALGILKADVDQLGMLMGCGLSVRRFTISRLAALSRQMHYYFALYLPHLLETRFRDVYTVFAGGDDLFLIGPWNSIYELAFALEENFRRYVCENPEVHFSAGMTLQKPHTPLNILAESAETALEKSKSAGRCRCTLFNETVTWDRMMALEAVRLELLEWISRRWLTRGMLYRLNSFIDMAERESRISQYHEVSMNDLDCLKWRSMLFYSAGRNVGKTIQNSSERKEVQTQVIEKLVTWLRDYRGALRIPLWNVLYHHR